MSKKRPRTSAGLVHTTASASSKMEPKYWRERLFNSSYIYKGKRFRVRTWSVKIQHLGRRKTFSLPFSHCRQAASEACRLYRTILNQGWENAEAQGGRLRDGLEALKAKYPSIGDARGMGLMQALEVVDPSSPDGKAPDPKKVLRVFEETRRLGLLIGKGGLYSNVIRLTPPMIVTAGEVDQALAVLDKAFAAAG